MFRFEIGVPVGVEFEPCLGLRLHLDLMWASVGAAGISLVSPRRPPRGPLSPCVGAQDSSQQPPTGKAPADCQPPRKKPNLTQPLKLRLKPRLLITGSLLQRPAHSRDSSPSSPRAQQLCPYFRWHPPISPELLPFPFCPPMSQASSLTSAPAPWSLSQRCCNTVLPRRTALLGSVSPPAGMIREEERNNRNKAPGKRSTGVKRDIAIMRIERLTSSAHL